MGISEGEFVLSYKFDSEALGEIIKLQVDIEISHEDLSDIETSMPRSGYGVHVFRNTVKITNLKGALVDYSSDEYLDEEIKDILLDLEEDVVEFASNEGVEIS